MTKAEIIKIRAYCENIKNTCDNYINLDPICHEPGDNYVVYISGNIEEINFILDKLNKDEEND